MLTVLLIDRTGRGHAIAEGLVRTNSQVDVHYAPGCAAISNPRIHCYESLSVLQFDPLLQLAVNIKADLVIVSNTFGLVDGCADVFRKRGFTVVGPGRQACFLEASKVQSKEFCARYGVPQAEFACFDNGEAANAYIENVPYDVVVKADGLCGGNGVFVCHSKKEARDAVHRILVEKRFGEAGRRIVIEERLKGTEFSYFGVIDGKEFVPLPMALDYPKSGDSDTGFTCAGVGSISPHPLDSLTLRTNVEREIIERVVKGIQQENLVYNGPIYFGCMLIGSTVVLLEINIRLGDPESQVIFPKVESDLYDMFLRVATSQMTSYRTKINQMSCCGVVAFQGPTKRIVDGEVLGQYQGWPGGEFGKGYEITGTECIETASASIFFGAAHRLENGTIVTDGGRPLTIVGFGQDMPSARSHAYENIRHVQFEGMSFRKDIGML